jgi:hypothetical protein
MNKKNLLQITAMSSIAFLGCNYAFAQTATHANNIIALDALSIGDLPTDIATVVTNLEGYLAFEEGNKTLLDEAVKAAEGTVTTAENTLRGWQAYADHKQAEINTLIAADPLDQQIAIEQANLAVIQANIITANATVATAEANVATAEANVANSKTKIALYKSALAPTGPVVTAKDAAAAAADDINQAVLDYTTPNSSAGGLEGVIAEIENVAAGDQAAVTTAITNADTAFQSIGAENASVADIQTLVGAIHTNLPNLPPISAADQTTAVGLVTDGAYERVAIADNAQAIADETTRATAAEGVNAQAIADETETRSGLIRREADGIHIGTNSFILDDTLGNHVLTTDDGSFTLGGGAVTEVDVDADLDVDGDIFASGDIFINGNAGVQAQLDTNAAGIANNTAAITSNTNSIAKNREDIDANTRGIAMVAALQHTTVLPGMTHALDISGAHFEGETGMALNYARRINENVQINFGAASTTDFDESVIKAGVGIQW